jgi:hypothetical protein
MAYSSYGIIKLPNHYLFIEIQTDYILLGLNHTADWLPDKSENPFLSAFVLSQKRL